MQPQEYNLTFWQGKTWRATIAWTDDVGDPKDLTDYQFRMQVRSKYADLDTAGPYVDIDSDLKGGITVNELAGTVALEVDGEVISDMPKGGYVYDIEFDDASGTPDKMYYGRVTVKPEVTR